MTLEKGLRSQHSKDFQLHDSLGSPTNSKQGKKVNYGFRGMKRLGVFLLPPGWDASPSQGQKKFTFCTNISNVVEEISSKQCFVTTTR